MTIRCDALAEPAVPQLSRALGGIRLAVGWGFGYFWLRVMFILSSGAFETPDTASYRSGQATRPPVSAALLSWLGDAPYIALSAAVSTAGFLALGIALWDPARRRWSIMVLALLGTLSFLPAVIIYEHWLVPDSLLIGLTLLGLAAAVHRTNARWHPWVLVSVCLLITTTKEQGIGAVALIALVLVARRSFRLAAAAVVTSALMFAIVVMPASNREGVVIWRQPRTTELTMERFRIVVAGLMWSDLSPELAEVNELSAACGMTFAQLVAETFKITDQVVAFENCPDLWPAVDKLSQLDVLLAHVHDPSRVPFALQRGFAPDMYAMAAWTSFPVQDLWVFEVDRWLMGAFALLPIVALALCLVRRRGRTLAFAAVSGSLLALAGALVDPTSQDRHTIGLRILAGLLAVMAIKVATSRCRPDDSTLIGADSDDEFEAMNDDHEAEAVLVSI